MMNLTRGETFTAEVTLDTAPEEMENLTLSIVQDGRTVVHREKTDAEQNEDGRSVSFRFTGAETAALRAGVPAFAQARGALRDGEVMKSAVEELCVLDTLGKEDKAWS